MYFIMEIQGNPDGTFAYLVHTAQSKNEAESVYHGVLQYAAISNLPIHSAVIISDDGTCQTHECYQHDQFVDEPPAEQSGTESAE